jgi:hypothetical protein
VRLPYEITGQSSQVDEILVRGAWSWKEDKPVEQFTTSELRRVWPGADGKDVKTREQHHGRFDAIEKIDSALAGDDGYQRSLLIIGHPNRSVLYLSLELDQEGMASERPLAFGERLRRRSMGIAIGLRLRAWGARRQLDNG